MNPELIVLVASILVIFGALMGVSLSKWQQEARARRQAAAQLSIYRQLRELEAERQNNAASNLRKPATWAQSSQRRAA